MASSSTDLSKALCITCNKAKGIFKCEGCSRVFCPKHSVDHRNELSTQLEEVVTTHDAVQQILSQQTKDPQQHSLIKQINNWETESIEKIHQRAKEIRADLLKNVNQHTGQIQQKLQLLSKELKQGREDNDFSETDLQKWLTKIEELRRELVNPATIGIQRDSTPLITDIHIDRQDLSDVFERVCGAAQISDNGKYVVKDNGSGHTEIRGKREYTTGRHTLRFHIENLANGGWVFFGIISKAEVMRETSYSSPSAYGWSNRKQTYIGGQMNNVESGDATHNDFLLLLIDCDQRKIKLMNERTNRTIEISVDINNCVFPWQLHLNLNAKNTRVRILSSSL